MSTRIGVEIEFNGDPHEAIANLQYHDLVSETREYDWTTEDLDEYDFAVKPDGSVDNGGELVSRIMDFDSPHDRATLFRAIDCLRQAGCTTSTQAGIHVHVGNDYLGDAAQLNLAKFFVGYEDAIYRQAASGWASLRPHIATYAHPFSRSDKAELIATRFKDFRTLRHVKENTRYYGLNLMTGHNTTEFRVFNSSLNKERILSHVAFSVAVVRAAAAEQLTRRTLSPTTTHLLGGMHEGWRDEESVYNSLMRVIRPHLTNADAALVAKYWKTSSPQSAQRMQDSRLPGWWGEDTKTKRAKAHKGKLLVPAHVVATDDQPEDYNERDGFVHPHGRDYDGDCYACGYRMCRCCRVCGVTSREHTDMGHDLWSIGTYDLDNNY